MRYLVFLAILGAIGWGGWQWIDGVSKASKLESFIADALEDAKGKSDLTVHDVILARANGAGYKLDSKDVQVIVTQGAGSLLSGSVNNAGITSSVQNVTITIHYTYPVLWMRLTPKIEDGRNYTSAEMTVNPAYNALGQ